jgi:hypothetical protein
MPPTLTSRVEVVITGTLVNSLDLNDVTAPLVVRRALDLSNGAGASQANVIWSDTRTLAPSASESLDLVGGGLADALGTALAPARLRALLIYASPANTNNLTILGNAAAVPVLNTAATTATLPPGGLFLITKPDAVGMLVTATTFDLIVVANAGAGTSVNYDIVLIGCAT